MRAVTGQPNRHGARSHDHAVRVHGASAFFAEGADQAMASRGTFEITRERGEAGMDSGIERLPWLFHAVESMPGPASPTPVFKHELTRFFGELDALAALGAGNSSPAEVFRSWPRPGHRAVRR